MFTLLQRHRREIALWLAYITLANTVGATSVLIEYHRDGRPLAMWEPFVWEYSSGVITLLLIPGVAWLERRFPFTASRWRGPLAVHLGATVPYATVHVGAMVFLRKVAYALAERSYDFGSLPVELLYEWRKDAMTYGFIVFVINAYRVFRERAEGEANYVASQEGSPEQREAVFRVTRKGRDAQLREGEVSWIEAAGNYVILHAPSGSYMMRSTLKALEERLPPERFLRVHRSAILNLEAVEGLERKHGNTDARLRSGERVSVSRRALSTLQAAIETVGSG